MPDEKNIRASWPSTRRKRSSADRRPPGSPEAQDPGRNLLGTSPGNPTDPEVFRDIAPSDVERISRVVEPLADGTSRFT